MINLSDCIELGLLGKPHGIKGQINLKLASLSFDDIQEMELVFVVIDGLPVPFFIEEFSEKNADTILLKFDTVLTESAARKFCDKLVYLDKKFISQESAEDFQPNNLVGYTVIDKHFGNIGTFDDVLRLESNSLLRILKGKTEILIPLQEEFIVSINDSAKEIIVDCPEGLLDLYL
jgi:16S rRNA processing protein RimM